MPLPKWMISAEEIRFFLKLIPDDDFSSIFRQYFSDARIEAYVLVHNIRNEDDDISDCCSALNVISYSMVKAKNNEVSAFIEMIEFLNSRLIDYIMAVKTNLSNRPVVMAMEKYISSLTDKTLNTSSNYHEVRTDKEGSRIEERTYNIVPVEALYNLKDNDGNDILTKDKILPNTRTVLRVYKEAEKHLKDDRKETSTLDFISSLPFTEENCHQIVFSVRSRWMYEAQHH